MFKTVNELLLAQRLLPLVRPAHKHNVQKISVKLRFSWKAYNFGA